MSRKKRQTITMVILCILLVLAGVGYYFLIRYQAAAQKEEETAEEVIPLNDMDSDKIEQFSCQREGQSLVFVKKDGAWSLQEDPDFPLDMTRVENMLGEVAAFSADQLVNDACDDISEYGLDAPEMIVDAQDSEGASVHIAIGQESLSGGGRYAYCDDQTKIYLVPTTLYTSFDYSREQLMEVPSLPSIEAEQVTYFLWENKKGRNFEASYGGDDSPFRDADSWSVDQPYSQAVAGDQEKLQELFGNLTTMILKQGVEYHCSKSDLKKYGLESPDSRMTVKYTEGEKNISKTLRMTVGKNSGEGYYVQIGGDKGVYIVESSAIDSILGLTPLDYVYDRLYPGNGNNLESMELEYKGKLYDFAVKEKQNVEDDEESGTTLVVKKNGTKVKAESFSSAYAAICNLAPTSEIDSSVKPVSDKPVAVFTFHEKKKDVPVIIYPYDGNNFYRVKVGKTMQFVVDMRTIDNIIKDFVNIE